MSQVPRPVLLGAAAIAALGLAAGAVWQWPRERTPDSTAAFKAPSPTPATKAPGLDEWRRRLAVLEESLLAEIEARRGLEADVAKLREELANLFTLTSEPETRANTAVEPRVEADSGEERPRFDEALLVVAGVEPKEVARLRERFNEFELDRLYLSDEAMRGGYWLKPRHRKELLTLQDELRAELGDELYDYVLFASGKDNRVIVRDVLDRSPAQEAGIEPGDVFLSYADKRIFSMLDLRLATAGGESGELVPVDVLRAERQVRVYVPRGPLGTGLRTDHGQPRSLR